MSSLGSYYTD